MKLFVLIHRQTGKEPAAMPPKSSTSLKRFQMLPDESPFIEYFVQVSGGRPIKCPGTENHRRAYFAAIRDIAGFEREEAETILRHTSISVAGVHFWRTELGTRWDGPVQ